VRFNLRFCFIGTEAPDNGFMPADAEDSYDPQFRDDRLERCIPCGAACRQRRARRYKREAQDLLDVSKTAAKTGLTGCRSNPLRR
jgi:hypothetical protein